MTLIIGMECTDAMLFCADRQENTEGNGKRSVSKIHEASGTNWQMYIATAGHGPIGDNASGKLIRAARKTPDFNLNPCPIIEEVIQATYERFIFPRDPQRQRWRDISLVIGIVDTETKRRFLYKTYEDVVKEEAHYACAGSGVDLAYYFLDYFYGDGLTAEEAYKVLAFILREANSSVDSVGKGSEFCRFDLSGQFAGFKNRQLLSDKVVLTEIPHLNQCIKPFWKGLK